jgi:hypothetical protein
MINSVKKYWVWRTDQSAKDYINEKRFNTAEKAQADAELFLAQTGPTIRYIEVFELMYIVKKGEMPITREYVWDESVPA